ncbi:MAG: O-succinylbenzoic acid--CoA ligase, partial [Litorivivens sp.]
GKIDFAAMTPYQVEQSLIRFPAAFETIDTLIVGGASIPQTLEQQLVKSHPQCFATYGMTETITHIAIRALNGPSRRDYFSALQGVELTQDQDDCIIIKAKHLGNEEIVTNDIAAFNDQGGFILLGRRDNVINSGGIKLHPEHIEQKIAGLLLRRYYISSILNPQFGERPVLIIEGEALEEQAEDALFETFASELTSIEMPIRIEYIDQFEQTATGKIKRRKA